MATEFIGTSDNHHQEQKKNTYFTTRLLLLCIGVALTILSIVSLLPASNSPTAIPTVGAAKVQFIHVIQHPIAEVLSPVGWVSFGIHLSLAAHVDLKITYMDKMHFLAVWFHYICCIYHCVCIGSYGNVILVGFIQAAVMLPIYFSTTAIRTAIRTTFYKRVKEEANLSRSNAKDRIKLEKMEGHVVVENLMSGFTIVGGMTFLLSEVTECVQGLYTKSEADAKCRKIYMNNVVILTVMAQVFLYKVLLIDTGSSSITRAVRCNAKTRALIFSNTMVGLSILQVFILFSVRHLPPSDLGFIFSLLFGYMPLLTMPVNLFIVVKEIKRNLKARTKSRSGDDIHNVVEDNMVKPNNYKDVRESISEKETTVIGGSTEPIISSNSKYIVVGNGKNDE